MSTKPLPADMLALLRRGRGVFTLAEAAAARVSGQRVRRQVRAGRLEVVGKGSYASHDQLASASEWAAHATRARGFVADLGPDVQLSGWSAVSLKPLPTLGPPPPLPTAVRPCRSGHGTQRTRFGVVHPMNVPGHHRAGSARCPAVGDAWMAVELARWAPQPDALVLADAVLRNTRATRQSLVDALSYMRHWEGRDRATWVVEHADACAESPLETLGRLTCLEYDLPVPLSNVWVGDGYPQFRVDHLWPDHWVVGEGDGAQKYRNGDDPGRVMSAQEERQWLIRRLDLDVVRYGWRLARYGRAELAGRFHAVLADNPPRPAPVRWWPTSDPWAA